MTKLTIFFRNSQCKQYYNVWLTDWEELIIGTGEFTVLKV